MLSIDATVLVTFAVVWILVLVLSRVFFKPMNRILGERTAGLEKARIDTETALAGCEENLRQIEERLAKSRAASEALWEQAEAQAVREKNQLLENLQAETRAQLDAATRELEREVEHLKKELDARSGELSEHVEQRILN